MSIFKKIFVFSLIFTLSTGSAHATSQKSNLKNQSGNDGVVQWSWDSPIKAPSKGCKNIKLKFKVIGGPRRLVSFFTIINNASQDVGWVLMSTYGGVAELTNDGRSGTKKLKICAEPWSANSYSTYAAAKPGTYDVSIETVDDQGYLVGNPQYYSIKLKK